MSVESPDLAIKSEITDPITGKIFYEDEEREKLQEITTQKVRVIFDKFRKFAKEEAAIIKSLKNRFLIKEIPNGTLFREYYTDPQPDFDFTWENIRHEAMFVKEGNVYLPARIKNNGEKKSGYETEDFAAWINNPHFDPHVVLKPGEIEISYGLFTPDDQYRETLLSYNASDNLSHLLFQGNDEQEYIVFSNYPDTIQELKSQPYFHSMNSVLEKGILEVGSYNDLIMVEHDKTTKKLIIKRTIAGELKDEIFIPLSIDRKTILNKLFPSPYFEDPRKTKPIEDTIWKSANLHTFGVEWLRY